MQIKEIDEQMSSNLENAEIDMNEYAGMEINRVLNELMEEK